eukprot:364685-Chlamydomonas_euryale.AAC.5
MLGGGPTCASSRRSRHRARRASGDGGRGGVGGGHGGCGRRCPKGDTWAAGAAESVRLRLLDGEVLSGTRVRPTQPHGADLGSPSTAIPRRLRAPPRRWRPLRTLRTAVSHLDGGPRRRAGGLIARFEQPAGRFVAAPGTGVVVRATSRRPHRPDAHAARGPRLVPAVIGAVYRALRILGYVRRGGGRAGRSARLALDGAFKDGLEVTQQRPHWSL